MIKNVLEPVLLLSDKKVEDCIYVIRGQQVMLDSDIAHFFNIETKTLNQQMRRNVGRFPEDFCFQINSNEFKDLRSQNVTFEVGYGKRKYLPYAYTEHGVIALAGVLKNDVADKMSVQITRAFIAMRKFILENGDTLLTLAKIQNRQLEFENKTNRRFDEIMTFINNSDIPKKALFFDGQFFDAHEFICNIISKAKKEIIIIDPYFDIKGLTMLEKSPKDVKKIIYLSPYAKLNKTDIDRFVEQYGDITIYETDIFHNRFIIVDKKECYDIGVSLNCVGKKIFSLNKIDEEEMVASLINKVNTISSIKAFSE